MKFFIFFTFLCLYNNCYPQYKSDNDRAYKMIEDFQLKFGNNKGLDGTKNVIYTKKTAKEFFLTDAPVKPMENLPGLSKVKLEAMYDSIFSGPYPTRYQDPMQYFVLKAKMDLIDKYAKMLYPTSKYDPKYGTFYSNSAAAETKVFHDDFLILVHEKFIVFAQELALTALAPYRKNFEGVDDEIDKDSIYVNFMDNFLAFYYEDYQRNVKLKIGNRRFNQYLFHWTNGLSFFVLAHEYAHAMLGHRASDEDMVSDQTNLQWWYNEVNADSTAQAILNKYLIENKDKPGRKGFIKYTALGNLYYFITLYNFENQTALFTTGTGISSGTAEEQEIMMEILSKKMPFEKALAMFQKLSPALRALKHPPTFIRMQLLAPKALEIGRMSLYKDDKDDKEEEGNAMVGKNLAFGLLDMMTDTEPGFIEMHNDKSYYDSTLKH